MEFTTQIVNISKIKEGFYIGDRATGLNLDLLIQFKITHIINASGSRLINAFETIGIKYLTLNWAESSSQCLFDPKDSLVDIIVSFIDDALKNGEGLLAHSVRGQNRVCIVVIVYLIKKYKWGLMKCIDFLHSKKADVDIPKYFLSQLNQLETRLSKEGLPHSLGWSEDGMNDKDEKVMRNTYVNGLIRKENSTSMSHGFRLGTKGEKARIGWGDFNPFNKADTLIHPNPQKDLLIQKDIKPVTSHMKLTPTKSCMKESKTLVDYGRNSFINSNGNSNYTANTSVNTNNNSSFMKLQDAKKSISNQSLAPKPAINSSFNRNALPLKQTNSFNNNDAEKQLHKERLNHFNYNCFEEDNGSGFDKRNNSYHIKNKNALKDIFNMPNSPVDIENGNEANQGINREGLLKKDSLNLNERPKRNGSAFNQRAANSAKENKSNSSEDIKLIRNDFIHNYNRNAPIDINNGNYKLLKTFDSGSPNNYLLNAYGKGVNAKKHQIIVSLGMNANHQPKIIKLRDENHKNPQFFMSQKPLNNFDPSLMKANQSMHIRQRSGTTQQGPITLPKDFIKKPLTPDQTLYASLKQEKAKSKIPSSFLYSNVQHQHQSFISQSKEGIDQTLLRPSTAPQKNKPALKPKHYQHTTNNSINGSNPKHYPDLIRLPSPMNKSNSTFQPIISSYKKYRAPSPMAKSSLSQQHQQYQSISLIK